MNAREWGPGDMVNLDGGGPPHRLMCVGTRWVNQFGSYLEKAPPADRIRPLSVIDPEDRDQVRRLVRRFYRHMGDDVNVPSEFHEECMAAALRGRGPKPPEPLGFGALVEDSAGVLWVSFRRDPNEEHDVAWCASRSGLDRFADYVDIDAVEVKFEGVLS